METLETVAREAVEVDPTQRGRLVVLLHMRESINGVSRELHRLES